jgi:hypothetical protein
MINMQHIYKQLKILIVMLLFSRSAFAISQLGITDLIFPANTNNIIIYESRAKAQIPQLLDKKTLTNATISELKTFTDKLLRRSLAKIRFTDANMQLKKMEQTNPEILTKLQVEELAANNDQVSSKNNFILIGYVSQIKFSQLQQRIFDRDYREI